MVPWRYATQGPNGKKHVFVVHVKDDLSSAKVTNISGTSDMTHSGWIFTAPEPPMRSKDPKGKAKAGVEESDKANPIPYGEEESDKVEGLPRKTTTSEKREYPLKKQPSSCESSNIASSR